MFLLIPNLIHVPLSTVGTMKSFLMFSLIAKESANAVASSRAVPKGSSSTCDIMNIMAWFSYLLLFKFPSEKDIPSSRSTTKECSKLSNAHLKIPGKLSVLSIYRFPGKSDQFKNSSFGGEVCVSKVAFIKLRVEPFNYFFLISSFPSPRSFFFSFRFASLLWFYSELLGLNAFLLNWLQISLGWYKNRQS